MDVEVLDSAERAASRAAQIIAGTLSAAIDARRQATLALSGGTTPVAMFRCLVGEDVAWRHVHLLQVDERVVAAGDPRSNIGLLSELIAASGIQHKQVHAMPVGEPDLEAAARTYARLLERLGGDPAVLDVVHLGLGADGHTASLVPGDSVLAALEEVAVTAPYGGLRRMTLTFPVLNRARQRVWLVTGRAKRAALERLLQRDRGLVATRVTAEHSIVVADREAVGGAPRP